MATGHNNNPGRALIKSTKLRPNMFNYLRLTQLYIYLGQYKIALNQDVLPVGA